MGVTRTNWRRRQTPTNPEITIDSPPVLDEGPRLPDFPGRADGRGDAPANWRDVPMPPGVAALPRDRRGYPVFATIAPSEGIAEDGKVDFRMLNVEAHVRCARERRCAICDEKLDALFVFIGGPMCVKARVFGDMALHPGCADYARRVCPFLVNAERQYDLRDKDGTTFDSNVITIKPKRLVLYYTDNYLLLPGGRGNKPVLVVPPATYVEWFTPDGKYVCRTRPTIYAQ
jgi:hypothetical protein